MKWGVGELQFEGCSKRSLFMVEEFRFLVKCGHLVLSMMRSLVSEGSISKVSTFICFDIYSYYLFSEYKSLHFP